ncbi:chaperone NapD [Sporomusa aerivorans]|uniref:chaperone NapD n=1 Tax=Sporomusa aerivorans TaxID=204936 RepID=UPI00352A32E7
MAISSMIVKPRIASVEQVTGLLAGMKGVSVHAVTDRQEIIIVVEAASLNLINETARCIGAQPGVLGVFPAYITMADEEATTVN